MTKKFSTRKRVVFLGIFITILLFTLTIRLAYIQIILSKTYSQKANLLSKGIRAENFAHNYQ